MYKNIDHAFIIGSLSLFHLVFRFGRIDSDARLCERQCLPSEPLKFLDDRQSRVLYIIYRFVKCIYMKCTNNENTLEIRLVSECFFPFVLSF